jgi:hypothetical protein
LSVVGEEGAEKVLEDEVKMREQWETLIIASSMLRKLRREEDSPFQESLEWIFKIWPKGSFTHLRDVNGYAEVKCVIAFASRCPQA